MEDYDRDDPDELVTILNPSADDFTYEVVDIHKKGYMISYTVKSRQSLKLPRYAANLVSEHLAQKMEGDKAGVITQEYHKMLLDQIRDYKWEEV